MKLKLLVSVLLGTVVLAISILWIMFRTGGDYAITLPNNYSLVRVYSGAVLIAHDKDGVVVEANVDGYAIVGSLIVGHSSKAEMEPERDLSKPGYFVLDTVSHSVIQGLDKKNWLTQLGGHGILTEPVLIRPER
mgnify:CR=1 FL=1